MCSAFRRGCWRCRRMHEELKAVGGSERLAGQVALCLGKALRLLAEKAEYMAATGAALHCAALLHPSHACLCHNTLSSSPCPKAPLFLELPVCLPAESRACLRDCCAQGRSFGRWVQPAAARSCATSCCAASCTRCTDPCLACFRACPPPPLSPSGARPSSIFLLKFTMRALCAGRDYFCAGRRFHRLYL